MNKIIKKIEAKTGVKNIVDNIITKISGSELNTLLLELFKEKSAQITPSSLLREYKKNRFGFPSTIDPLKYKKEETLWLEEGLKFGFKPVILSPLTPLGTTSAVAFVDQNNTVSSSRGAEVVSDATNVLALQSAAEIKEGNKNKLIKYSATHRHVRAQYFTAPGFTAHFGAYCMTTAGRDTGNNTFELENLMEHVEFYFNMLSKIFDKENISLHFYTHDLESLYNRKLLPLVNNFTAKHNLAFHSEALSNNYYDGIQFKYFVKHNNNNINIADGGFVNWTKELLSDNKQKFLISAAGIELVAKMKDGQL